MIDWDRVSELRDEVGEDALDEVVEMFLEEVEEVIARLQSDGDPLTYEEDLHFLKGSALNLGFRIFGNLCEAGEKSSANGQAESVDMAAIFQAYETSKADFVGKLETMGQAA